MEVVPREPQVSIEDRALAAETLSRVGTCLAWQWMCPNYCGYVLGISADRDAITQQAERHLGVCSDE